MSTQNVVTPPGQRALALRTDIQGVRAISLILIVFFHAHLPPFRGGFIGPDVFFVISGFLISTHLMESMDKTDGIGFAQFYAKRIRRLVPTALVVTTLTVIGALVWVPRLQLLGTFESAIAATLYVPNMLFAWSGTNYLQDTTPSLFTHYWTLGVEEQFYFVWPVLLFVIFRVFKTVRTRVIAVTALSLASFALCVFLTAFIQPWGFFTLPSRAWAFGVGSLVGFALLHDRWAPRPITAAILGWVGLSALLIASVVLPSEMSYPGAWAAIPVAATALIIISGATPTAAGPFALLSLTPLTFLGDVSYSVYLVHWPILQLPLAARGYMDPLPLWVRILLAIACVPVGWVIYKTVERPCRQARWLAKGRPSRTFAVAGAAMAVSLALVASTWALVWPPRLSDERTVAVTQITPQPPGTPFVPANLEPSLLTAYTDDKPGVSFECFRDTFYTDPTGCLVGYNPRAPLVVLFGDSHAAQWHPALAKLAEEGRIRLDTRTKVACPAASHTQFGYPQCAKWRRGVIAQLNENPPDVILVSGAGYRYMTRATTDQVGVDSDWREATLATLKELPRRSRIAVIGDTPSTGVVTAVCLSNFLDDAARCAVPRDHALYPSLRLADESAAKDAGAAYFDYTDLFCNATTCPSIIGNTLVYRDNNHITEVFSRAMAPNVLEDINHLLS